MKFFADGVIEHGTGMLLEPYSDDSHSCGLPNWAPDALAEAVTAFDADGFQIHIHAIGDGGIRMALDAIETAVRRNTRPGTVRDRRPVIAHTQLVDPADRPRFAALGVIANFEPLWAQMDPVLTELTLPRLGPERSRLLYPIATLHRHGGPLSFGSDWPVTSANPLEGLAVAVTRQTPDGSPAGGWMPEERLPIAAAIGAYTRGVAHQAFADERGHVQLGALADFTLVEHDITALPGHEVADVAVRGLWAAGEEVWRS
ncbi:MAG: amidohydrolase family protein [Acidimicrobiales bacterium]